MALKERTSHKSKSKAKAKTKPHVNRDGSVVDVPIMTTIGNGVTIGQDPHFDICKPIEIGDGVTIGEGVTLKGNNHIHSGAVLEDGSTVGHGVAIPAGKELKRGVTVYDGANYLHLLPGKVIDHDLPTLQTKVCDLSSLRV